MKLAGALMLVGGLIIGCNQSDGCGNQVVASSASPNGRMFAVVFARDCGATTRESIQMSILPANDPFPIETLRGNALIVQPPRGGSRSDVLVEWIDELHVRASRQRDAEVFKAERSVNGVEIEYRDTGGSISNAK